MKREKFLGFVLAAVMLVVAISPALAHDHKELGNWKVTFGMTPEPVFTGQFYKTTWKFEDDDGNPVKSLQDLSVTIIYNGKAYGPFTVKATWGEPGLYDVPTIFAKPGQYRFVLSGKTVAAGTDVPFEIEFSKDILDASVITVGG